MGADCQVGQGEADASMTGTGTELGLVWAHRNTARDGLQLRY